MKKLALLLLIPLMGCMTDNALKAELGYYQMLYTQKSQPTPLVRLDIADPNKPINLKTIEVFAPPSNTPIAQYVQKDYVQPWLNIVGAAIPWFGMWGVTTSIMDGVTKMGNNTSMNISGQNNTGAIVGPTNNNLTGTGHTAGGILTQTDPAQVVIPPVYFVPIAQ